MRDKEKCTGDVWEMVVLAEKKGQASGESPSCFDIFSLVRS
jgi:hypothetical protein